MLAIIETGGKQYRVAPEDRITIMRIGGEVGDAVAFDQVLMVGPPDALQVGSPRVAGVRVMAKIVAHKRGPKVIAFKKRRRKNSRSKHGHRQDLTIVQIENIDLSAA